MLPEITAETLDQTLTSLASDRTGYSYDDIRSLARCLVLINADLQRLTNHVNREIGVAHVMPLHERWPINLEFEEKVLRTLRKLEEQLSTNNTALGRVQADTAAMATTLTNMQNSVATLATNMSAGNLRLLNAIQALRNAPVGDTAALNAVADSLEATQKTFGAIGTQLDNMSAGEAVEDLLTISPLTGNVAPGATLQFSSSDTGATYAAQNGTITTSGLYTAPTTGSSDVVTATSADGTQTAMASLSIG